MTDDQPIDREALKAHVIANAFDTGRDCDTCKGEGRVYPGRRIIHTRLGGLGADWDEAKILDAIDEAPELGWGRGWFGAYLAVVLPGGKVLAVEVPPMSDPEDAAVTTTGSTT